jgi:hypothetical protein
MKTTARIELKRRIADGGRRRPLPLRINPPTWRLRCGQLSASHEKGGVTECDDNGRRRRKRGARQDDEDDDGQGWWVPDLRVYLQDPAARM